MNKILYNRIHCLLLFSMAMAFILLPACKKNTDGNAPVITGVRNYEPAPGDSVLQSLLPGQWVVLLGYNLSDAVQISFNGIPAAAVNNALYSDTSVVVQVPAVIPFPSVPAEELNTIHYITTHGSVTFTFDIVAPPPTIAGISNENANEGDSVYINGLNFFFVEEVIFAGVPVTGYAASGDGTSIGFVVPALTQSGSVIVTTKSGADTTVYNVNNASTESLCNFDNINTLNWGTNTDNNSTNFPGNRGYYAVLSNGVFTSSNGNWWEWQRSINTNSVQWIPAGSLSDPVSDYAFKFEISVQGEWSGTSIFIIKDYSWNYLARYEPWKDAVGNVFTYSANGWKTVTIPLSMFRSNNGQGASAPSLTSLLGSSGSGQLIIYTTNASSSPTATGLNAAVDNIRVVKIK